MSWLGLSRKQALRQDLGEGDLFTRKCFRDHWTRNEVKKARQGVKAARLPSGQLWRRVGHRDKAARVFRPWGWTVPGTEQATACGRPYEAGAGC